MTNTTTSTKMNKTEMAVQAVMADVAAGARFVMVIDAMGRAECRVEWATGERRAVAKQVANMVRFGRMVMVAEESTRNKQVWVARP